MTRIITMTANSEDLVREEISELATAVVAAAVSSGTTLASAESLTAGELVARLVDIPGASACVRGGATCYAWDTKASILGVNRDLLEQRGAVCAEVAVQMSQGASALYDADIGIATTGVAGPGSDARGVAEGTVYIAVYERGGEARVTLCHFEGDRSQIRLQSVREALSLTLNTLVGG